MRTSHNGIERHVHLFAMHFTAARCIKIVQTGPLNQRLPGLWIWRCKGHIHSADINLKVQENKLLYILRNWQFELDSWWIGYTVAFSVMYSMQFANRRTNRTPLRWTLSNKWLMSEFVEGLSAIYFKCHILWPYSCLYIHITDPICSTYKKKIRSDEACYRICYSLVHIW